MKKKRMKRLVSIILALFTLAALLPISTISVKAKGNVTDIFSDVKEGAWYVSAIQYVYDNGIMVGTGSAFGVNNSLKREQFAATLYSMAGKPVVADDTPIPFSDVSNKTGYPRDAILWAVENGIAAGNADGTFGVGKSIQRQAVASMLYKYAQLCGFDLTTDEKALSDFCDADKVQSWATTSMKWAVTQDIISGKEILNHNYTITFADDATKYISTIRKKYEVVLCYLIGFNNEKKGIYEKTFFADKIENEWKYLNYYIKLLEKIRNFKSH